MIVVGIETSTPQSSVAVGTGEEILASTSVAAKAHQESVIPILQHLLRWAGLELRQIGGVAVGVGPGLYTGLRVGVATGKALAQALRVPIVGLCSLDVLAFAARYTEKPIVAAIDARRKEVFSATYRPAPGGVVRTSEHTVGTVEHLAAELEATGEEVLLVGDGALLYRERFARLGGTVEFASPSLAHPLASALVELSVPRFIREEPDRLFEVVPIYLRKTDAEIAWDQRARGA